MAPSAKYHQVVTLRACKGFHQSAASAKLNPELRLFIEPVKDFINRLRAPNSALYFGFFETRCAASHPKKGLAQNLICLLSLKHENLYKLLIFGAMTL
jgi:hypothetical protein